MAPRRRSGGDVAAEPAQGLGLVPQAHPECAMFVFFSSGLGCLGSILVSVVLTLVLLAVFGAF